jgi:hypothetical protein
MKSDKKLVKISGKHSRRKSTVLTSETYLFLTDKNDHTDESDDESFGEITLDNVRLIKEYSHEKKNFFLINDSNHSQDSSEDL